MSLYRSLAFLSASALLAGAAFAQANDTSNTATTGRPSVGYPYGGTTASPIMYTNGTFITNPTGGFGGAPISEISAGYNTFGFGHALSTGFRVADNFTVPAGQGWDIAKMRWFAYQTGSLLVPTITSINVRIWDGAPPPVGTGVVIAGDTTTNRLVSTGTVFSGVYRVTSTAPLGTTRPIMDCEVDMTWVPVLGPGTYYVDVQCGGSLASGPWAPPTAPPQQGGPLTDNGLQFNATTMTWGLSQDTTALLPQDFPFTLMGNDCNPSTTYCTNLISSSGCSPVISANVPNASLSNPAGFTVTCSQLEDNKNGLIFFGTTGPDSSPFFGGTLCVASPLYRLPVQNSGGTLCLGTMSNTLADYLAHPSGGSLLIARTKVNTQGWFRDPGATLTVGLTGGLDFYVCP